jgi:hydroxymethylpyrimidine pyrophosphatase-like HAD family hydrolase
MRYLVLCCDYDGTLAHGGQVSEPTIDALERLLASGRRLVLVTGRELSDLSSIFNRMDLFEIVVAENGALLYFPASRKTRTLGERPPEPFVQSLRKKGVAPISVGHVIVSTREPYETAAFECIRDLGLELHVIFNKGAVMILPSGINKATGLTEALKEIGIAPHNAVGIGDAENDHAFLAMCECSVAVANALSSVKETADFVTRSDHGAGVIELVDELLADDLANREPLLERHHILVGTDMAGQEVRVPPYGINLLLLGTSGSGKSTAAKGLLERLAERGYSFCIIDPEGDYSSFEGTVAIGTTQRAPSLDEILALLARPDANVVANLVGLPIPDRPSFFLELFPRLQALRAKTGQPHWMVVDETHHLLPAAWEPAYLSLPHSLDGLVRITVHPDLIAPKALASVGTVIVVGSEPEEMLAAFSHAIGEPPPVLDSVSLQAGEALVWLRTSGKRPFRVHLAASRGEHQRHRRKYAEGELPPDRSFYFRGPEGKFNLRAQNLILFLQLADGVDDSTWLYHLHAGDYSRWFRDCIKDSALAAEADQIAAMSDLSAQESRKLIRSAVEQEYTLPVSVRMPIAGTDTAMEEKVF